jgi:hypothetical protein
MAQVIDIGAVSDGPALTLNKSEPESPKPIELSVDKPSVDKPSVDKPSVNFGGGIEFLMNDKLKTDNKQKADIDLGDINELESELNNLTEDISIQKSSSLENIKINDGPSVTSNSVKFEDLGSKDTEIPSISTPMAKATASQSKDEESNKTWDGFGKFNNIPLDPDKQVPAKPKLTHEELLREKFKALRKLEALEKKGVKLSKRYTMESSLEEMQGEYELIISEKECSASCKFQGRMLMAAVTGLEFLNNRFDPFDIKLDGWAEQLNENMDDYDEIFAELHEKYKSKATMAPELKLLFQLGGSAIMVHMTNTMFKSAMPGMDDIMRQNPELMQQFTQAAVNSMSETSPGFGGFMNGVMGNDDTQPNVAPGPPPAPMPTQTLRSKRNEVPNNRPDMSAARGDDDGISISENFGSVGAEPPMRSTNAQRPEMKGPSDISDLLSGLKTKTIDISAPTDKKDSSTISIQDLKEISDAKQPSRSKRRQKSDKNVVSLEL